MAVITSNRRDFGYTVISRFEATLRNYLVTTIFLGKENFVDYVPTGIISKIKDKNPNIDITDVEEFLEQTDFPDLKEVILYRENFNHFQSKIEKKKFSESMDVLYSLRCKIAHVKGYFNSLDLDKLIELSQSISITLKIENFQSFIQNIKTTPKELIIKIPADFVEDHLDKYGIINNLPIPDYEYEGGFVGREEDQAKILQLLNSSKFPVVTLTGAGGVGKTALALKIIYDLTTTANKNELDAIVWLSAKENRLSLLGIEEIEPTLKSYDELLDTIIELFGFKSELNHDTIDAKELLVEKIFELTRKIIILVDNLETITDQRIINFILDAPLNVKFIITSRRGIGQLERRHELKELTIKEATYLFRQIAKDKQQNKLASLPDEIIKKYVLKVSCYPLAIKWVIGQVARGKDINKIIDSIHNAESDISKFCFEQIFESLSDDCKKIIYTLSLIDTPPTESILQYVTELEEKIFEDSIEELILVSLVIPEQFQNEKKEISTKYILLPLTTGYTRLQLNKNIILREYYKKRINEIESVVNTTERVKKEYKHSLYNFGATSEEEKVAAIIAQTAFQKYQNGFYEQAIEDYKRAIKIAPGFSSLYRNWAVMESYENHIPEADSLMHKAAELNPNDPQIFLLWGNIYRKSYKIPEALEKYIEAYKLAPQDPIILNAYGQACSRLGDYKKANELLVHALDSDSNFSSLKHEIINRTSLAKNFIWWGEALIQDKNEDSAHEKFTSAINQCEEAITSKATDPLVYSTLASAQLQKGQLFKKSGKLRDGFNLFKTVIKSDAKNDKHLVYQITALIEVCEIHLTRNILDLALDIMSKIDIKLKESTYIKKHIYQHIENRIRDLKFQLSPETMKKGLIIRVENTYVLIEEHGTKKTYTGLARHFIPQQNRIDSQYLKQKVVFNTMKFVKKDGEEKEGAINIKLVPNLLSL